MANPVAILEPWAKQPGGMFFHAYNVMLAFASYGKNSTVSNEERINTVRDAVILTSYIGSAKRCFTDEIKKLCVDSHYPWAAGLCSREEFVQWVEKGTRMSDHEADLVLQDWMKNTHNPNLAPAVLYQALCLSGSDGLNTEEIIRFLRVGRHFNFSEKQLNDLLILYFHECALMKAFYKNIVGQSKL